MQPKRFIAANSAMFQGRSNPVSRAGEQAFAASHLGQRLINYARGEQLRRASPENGVMHVGGKECQLEGIAVRSGQKAGQDCPDLRLDCSEGHAVQGCLPRSATPLNATKAQGATGVGLADPLPFNVAQAASGRVTIVTNKMDNAICSVSVERRYDPRDFVLICAGGATGVHTRWREEWASGGYWCPDWPRDCAPLPRSFPISNTTTWPRRRGVQMGRRPDWTVCLTGRR